jgi:hypothetical protein
MVVSLVMVVYSRWMGVLMELDYNFHHPRVEMVLGHNFLEDFHRYLMAVMMGLDHNFHHSGDLMGLDYNFHDLRVVSG